MTPQATEAAAIKTCRCYLFHSREVCGQPATVRVRAGCVHEHIVAVTVCDIHAEQIVSGDVISCPQCFEGTNSHRCDVIGRRTP